MQDMGKSKPRPRKSSATSDPVLDELAVIDAKGMFYGSLLGLGWRLAIMVLLPIFIGVQLDKRFDSAPSITLAAFFVAIFGAGVMVNKMYKEINAEQALMDKKYAKRSRKLKRTKNA